MTRPQYWFSVHLDLICPRLVLSLPVEICADTVDYDKHSEIVLIEAHDRCEMFQVLY